MSSTTSPSNAFRLENGDALPQLSATAVGGGQVDLPGDLAGSWGVVLFYRGHWCPVCQSQLKDFQRHLDQLSEAGIKVVAVSVDPESDAAQTVEDHGIEFPVGSGVDPQELADTFGNYLSDGSDGHSTYSQATGFVVTPDGRIALALYSSGAIGRLNASDTLGMIKHAQS